MAKDFGDEDGVFWLPAPGKPATKGAKGVRQPRIHVPRGNPPESYWTPPTDFPRLSGVVALDVETNDPDLKKVGPNWCRPGVGHLAGFAVAWEGGERYYPFGHEGGSNLDKEVCLRYLRDLAAQKDIQFVGHNMPYDVGWTWGREEIKFANTPWDTQAAVALLDEYRQRSFLGYNLNAVGRDYCNILKDETKLKEAADYYGLHDKKELWRLDAKYVGEYGETDAGNCLQIWHTVEPLLREQNLWSLFELEMRYSVVTLHMRQRGVRVDVPRAERFRDELARREAEASRQIQQLIGFEVPVWEAAKIEKAMKVRGINYPRTAPTDGHPDGQPSFTAPWLKTIDDPFAKLLLQVRRWEKVRGTFVEGFFLELATNGRVYPQINPLPTDDSGAVSGRSSCEKPNLQQLSAKDIEMAMEVRGLCLPEEGAEWAALDYSQQEPRLAVHFAWLAGVRGARRVVELYRSNPRIDFHQMVADLASIGRPQAKILNLAIIYGKGEAAICRELGFDTEFVKTRRGRIVEVAGPEGKAFIEAYHKIVPFASGLKDACSRAVKQKGYIRTLLGRRCRFGEGKATDHMGVNRLVQGSAADQLKKANVDMFEQLGEIPLVNVHDEIGMNKWSQRQLDLAVQCMVETTPLEVPVVVDVAVGSNWGEAL
jgi:DNA polymerase I-like protein with 3'-5' exonuclease and polymerase domains